MAENSEISWTTHTFNIVWGCTKVSEACKHCYADTLSTRYGKDLWGADKPRQIMSESYWRQPLKWEKEAAASGVRARVFCSSMADVFEDHATVASQRLRLWDLIARTPHLDWLLLTKRADKMIEFAPASWADEWPRNVWAGVTVENQARGEERISPLLRVPARVRFLSMEPLLGPIEIGLAGVVPRNISPGYRPVSSMIHWVIVGGESGHGARPMQPEWARALRNECAAADVPFHFKQWGEYNSSLIRLGKKAAGYLLDGVEHRAFPEVSR